MSYELATPINASLLEQVLIGGDLSRLSPADRVVFYTNVCESLGLNALTKPFDYITLNGKMTLYAKRDCTDQLRKVNGVSIVIMSREVTEDCYTVTARATDRTGRTDESIGAVPMGNLKGESRSNAMMKAETKAKRRVTLSICGLGFLDETEASSIIDTSIVPQEENSLHKTPQYTANGKTYNNKIDHVKMTNSYPIEAEDSSIEDTINDVRRFLGENKVEQAYKICQSLTPDVKTKLWFALDTEERATILAHKEKIQIAQEDIPHDKLS